MNTLTKTRLTQLKGYDRRDARRASIEGVALHCWSRGRKLSLHVIEVTRDGARVILPPELSKREELTLVCNLPQGEFYGEYRVVWKQNIAGQKVIAGLHCLLSSDRLAA